MEFYLNDLVLDKNSGLDFHQGRRNMLLAYGDQVLACVVRHMREPLRDNSAVTILRPHDMLEEQMKLDELIPILALEDPSASVVRKSIALKLGRCVVVPLEMQQESTVVDVVWNSEFVCGNAATGVLENDLV